MKFTIVVYSFVITFFVLLVVFRYLWSRQKIRERFAHLVDVGVGGDSTWQQDKGLRGIIKKISVYFEATEWAIKKENQLLQAGIPFRGSEFLVISVVVSILGILLILALTGGSFLVAVIGGILVFCIPTILVNLRINKRRALFNEQLPDALTMMANSLRSGYSYMRAIDLVAKEIPEPLGKEFAIVVEETTLGITTDEAFNNLARRVCSDDVDLTVMAFTIQRQVGGNLAELLDNIAATIRGRVRMKEKVKTLTAQGKVSAFILCSLPIVVGVLLYLLNQEYMSSFLNQQIGMVMIGLGIVGQIIGVIWMKKIISVEL